ncbi:MerR family transcriptional regulator [Glycomyces paridis]|uniref:MerR family transcriptional regulator n=1 Tax=Glycomyces paridis TaxID=2126555 RepID=A0A4S8P7F0_9ACTN|nr:TipAS antibiotic-recognition domain-containing protein [Glycomyces paridis]THV26188.1 MerR family transcriptional regulator [Glycomyces paridis]
MRTWPTAEVARMAGVSARTLRHYDAIGLLTPAETGHGGLRRYGRSELLRLQQILLLKRLGLRLDTIADVLEGDLDRIEALKRHAAGLAEERRRLERLAATVDATIRQLEGGPPMTPETWFDGLDPATEAAHRAEARSRWGQAVVERAWTVLQELRPEERRAIPAEFDAINARLQTLRDAGAAPDDDAVQTVVADHYRLVARHWDSQPGAEAYKGLAALYTEDPRFADTYDQVADGFAAYLAEAIRHWADTHL